MEEPRKHPLYMTMLAVAALGTVPVLFVGGVERTIFGLPLWLWSSVLFTVLLSALTAWGVLRYWRDEPESEDVPPRPEDGAEKRGRR